MVGTDDKTNIIEDMHFYCQVACMHIKAAFSFPPTKEKKTEKEFVQKTFDVSFQTSSFDL